MVTIRRLSIEEFENSYPERGLSHPISIATIELDPDQGFSVVCSGTHYVNEKGARQSCSWQNMLRQAARRRSLKIRTAHNGDELQVYRDK